MAACVSGGVRTRFNSDMSAWAGIAPKFRRRRGGVEWSGGGGGGGMEERSREQDIGEDEIRRERKQHTG